MIEVDLTRKFLAEQLINHRNGNSAPEPTIIVDLSENCELCHEDALILEEIEEKKRLRNERDAEIILFKLGLPDPNRKFTPEER